MDISNAKRISHQEASYGPQPPYVKHAPKIIRLLVEIAPARLDAFFDSSAISKKERGILAVLESRILEVRADLLANCQDARNRARMITFVAARDTPDPGRRIPNFAQMDREASERFESARMARSLLGADLWSVLRPIFARLGGELQRRRPAIEKDLISRAAAIGVTMPLDCDQLLAIGALIYRLIPVPGSTTSNFQTPSEVFRDFGFDLNSKP